MKAATYPNTASFELTPAQTLIWAGQQRSGDVPLYNMAHSLWYRKSVFEKAGVTPPTTWSEWLEAAGKLSSDEQYGIGLPANRQLYTDQTVYDVMINAGADEIYNADGTLQLVEQKKEIFD